MPALFFIFLSFFASAQTVKVTFGSNDLPEPFYADEFSTSAVTYESIDWRNYEGKNWLSPVRNQSNCGACVAFSAIATLEDTLTISTKALWKKESFSQEALFSVGKNKCSSGWFIFDAAKAIEKYGVLDSACAPYTAGSTGRVPVYGTFCADQANRTFKIKGITHPVGAAQVKEALKKGPLMTSMTVRMGFDSYSGGIYKSTFDDKILGGHAVALVGYNDLERYWIIKNSWSEDWGEKGFGRVSYDDISGVGADAFGFILDEKTEGIESPVDREYVKGTIKVKGKFTSLEIFQKDKFIKTLDCQGACTLNTLEMNDGEYVLKTKSSNERIITSRFTVMNKTSQFEMKVTAPLGYDYSYPQSDRLLFDVNFKGEGVPEALVMEFRQNGKIVAKRTFTDIYSQMRIGYNCIALKSATYDVAFRHRTFGKESVEQVMKVTVKNE